MRKTQVVYVTCILLSQLLCVLSMDKGGNVCPYPNGTFKCCADYRQVQDKCIECVGYYGIECRRPCKEGFYGIGCKQECKCNAGEQCNRFVGCWKGATTSHSDSGGAGLIVGVAVISSAVTCVVVLALGLFYKRQKFTICTCTQQVKEAVTDDNGLRCHDLRESKIVLDGKVVETHCKNITLDRESYGKCRINSYGYNTLEFNKWKTLPSNSSKCVQNEYSHVDAKFATKKLSHDQINDPVNDGYDSLAECKRKSRSYVNVSTGWSP